IFDHAHVAQAGEGHREGPRDRRRGQRQYVDSLPKLLEPLLMGDAEALLLVHNDQADVSELHVLREQPVRSDDDIDRPDLQLVDDLLLLLAASESAQELYAGRIGGKALAERGVVL